MGSSLVRFQIFMLLMLLVENILHMMYTFLLMINYFLFFVMEFDANHVSSLYNRVDCIHALTILKVVLLDICELLHR